MREIYCTSQLWSQWLIKAEHDVSSFCCFSENASNVSEFVFQIASKYDHQAEEDLRNWIEEVTGMSIGTNFQLGLKDGIILCE